MLSRLWLSITTIAVLASSAQAVPSDLSGAVSDVERASQALSIRFRTQPAMAPADLATHRLVDAQVLYNLKDYTRAAILLLDYVNKYKNAASYPDALFFLADSLYHKRDFLSAKRYFLEIVNSARGKYYQDALQRLIELALRTGDVSDVGGYLSALDQIPAHQLKSSVPYVRGKYYYFSGQTDQAIGAFQQIAPEHDYYMHAQYFIGACQVRKKDHATALKVFEALLKREPKTESQKRIRELTHLAAGRLLYDKNQIVQAIDQYQHVSRKSDEFDTALYEIAWAYIKARSFMKALRALDLLVLANPESSFVPEVKVLQGNLLIRVRSWGRATDLFSSSRDYWRPIHKRMTNLLDEQKDPNVFFDALLARSMSSGSLAVAAKVPKVAVSWVREKPRVKRALLLVEDVRAMQDSLDETKRLIRRLESTINSPAKIKIYPEYAVARENALEVENRVSAIQSRLLELERQLFESKLSPQERADLQAVGDERARLERRIDQLPQDRQAFNGRAKHQLKRIAELDREVSLLGITVQNLDAQLVAAEKYFADTGGAVKKGPRESFNLEATNVRALINGLHGSLDELRQDLAAARDASGIGGPEEVAERAIKARYSAEVKREHAMMLTMRGKLSGSDGNEFDALASLMTRSDQVELTVQKFNDQLTTSLDNKLASIRQVINEEKNLISAYRVTADSYNGDTNEIAGGMTYEGFRQVARRFYDIIVRSEVGIIDVAWALKDTKTKEVGRLVRQRRLDLKVLDEEFKEVLKSN